MKLNQLIENRCVFEKLLSPITVKTFFDDYLMKVPLFVEGFSSKFDFLPDRTEILSIVSNASNIRAVFKGLKQIEIRDDNVYDMFDVGATICITGLESAHKRLEELCRSVKHELGFNGDVSLRAYWSPKGSGFNKHWDPRMVTTIQIEGTKTWFYASESFIKYPQYNSPFPLTKEMDDHLTSTKIHCVTLNAGDLLCLPPGLIHWAEGKSDNSFAFNLAFDYIGNNSVDALIAVVKSRLDERSDLQAPLFGVGIDGVRDLESKVDNAVKWIKSTLDDVAMEMKSNS